MDSGHWASLADLSQVLSCMIVDQLFFRAVLLFLVSVSSATAGHADRVLLLYSYNPTFPTSEKVLAGVQSVFSRHDSILLDVEYMNAKRHPDATSRELFLNDLRYRLASRPDYDVVMVVDDAALMFAEEHQQSLFRRAPIVYLAINNYDHARAINAQGLATGVIEKVSVEETLELVKRVTPNRKRLWIVTDGTMTGQQLQLAAAEASGKVKGLVTQWLSLAVLTMPELQQRIKGLGKSDALLLMSAYSDAAGNMFSFDESLELIVGRSQVPVFHLWEHGMGRGVLGGVLISHFEQGRVAAEQALQVMHGKPLSDVKPVFQSPNVVQIDMREVQRFGIAPGAIPPQALRLFEPVSFLKRFQLSVILALSLVPLLIGLLIFMFWQARERSKLGRELENKETQLRLLVRTIPDLVWFKDIDGRYVLVNRAVEEFLGIGEGEAEGKTPKDFFDADTVRTIDGIDRSVMTSRHTDVCEQRLTALHGPGDIEVETIRVPVYDKNGTLNGVLGIGRDISRRVAAEQRAQDRETLLSSVISEMPDIFVLKDRYGKFLLCNDNVANLYNTTPEQMVGKDDADFGVPPELSEKMRDSVLDLMSHDRSEIVYEDSTDVASGEVRHFKSIKKPIRDMNGDSQIIVIAQDITDMVRAQQQIRENEQQFRTILDNIDAYVYLKDTEGRYLFVNRLVRELWQVEDEDILGKADESFFDEESARKIRKADEQVLRGNQVIKRDEHVAPQSTGRAMSFQATKLPLFNDDGEVYALCGISIDVTRRVEYQRELERIALFDPLTGLMSRSQLTTVMQQRMEQVQKESGVVDGVVDGDVCSLDGNASASTMLVVLYIDLDGFKQINDAVGHETGDEFLKLVAHRLREVAGPEACLARYGGDEFIAVLEQDVCKGESDALLEAMLNSLSQPIDIDGLVLKVTASIGVTHYPQQEEQDPDQLVRQADQAMYIAKTSGKNRFHYFDAVLNVKAANRQKNLERLALALENDELELYFQPKVNMRDGLVVGAEALLRWNHPERGVVAPGDFLPDTEHHYLGIQIGDWVIHQALNVLSRWNRERRFIPLSINISNLQLSQVDFVSKLAAEIKTHPDFIPGSLELEILETTALEDIAEVSKVIWQCEDMGVYFSIDDFGTGYSSLTYLKRLPARQLKIDQSFVADILVDPEDLSIVNSVVTMATGCGMEVVAEGVETIEHGTVLMGLGCDLAQGYGIAKPMPLEDFGPWADNWKPPARWIEQH